MNVGIICTALLGLLLFGLGLYVSILRGRTRRSIGCDTNPTDPLHRAVRAHGNTAEYAPFLGLLFLWFAMHPASSWVAGAIVIATLARFLLVAGLLGSVARQAERGTISRGTPHLCVRTRAGGAAGGSVNQGAVFRRPFPVS